MIFINRLSEDKQFRNSVLWVFIFGMMAHAFFYYNVFYSHDSLMIYHNDDLWKIALGRHMTPFYRSLRTPFGAPWLIGALSLIYLSFSVYFLVKLFDIRNMKLIALVSGVFATNFSLTALNATYMHDADVYMLAVLLYVLSAYLLLNFRGGWSVGGVVLAIALGLYQAYISLTVSIVLLFMMREILNNSSVKKYISIALKFVGMMGIAYLFYKVSLEFCLLKNNISIHDGYNGIANIVDFSEYNIFKLLCDTYIYPFKFWTCTTGYNTKGMISLTLFVLLCLVIMFGYVILKSGISVVNKVLSILAFLLVPFAINSVYFISKGMIHDLMIFSYGMVHVLVVMLVDYIYNQELLKCDKWKGAISYTIGICLMVFIFHNISYANGVYLKKELDYQSTLLTCNRIIDRVEMTEGYKVDDTEVVLVGSLNDSVLASEREGFESRLLATKSFSVTYYSTYRNFIVEVLNYPMNIVGEDVSNIYKEKQEVIDMPVFPDKNSVKMVDDKLVVKLSE